MAFTEMELLQLKANELVNELNTVRGRIDKLLDKPLGRYIGDLELAERRYAYLDDVWGMKHSELYIELGEAHCNLVAFDAKMADENE
jgi:hypothetical protein